MQPATSAAEAVILAEDRTPGAGERCEPSASGDGVVLVDDRHDPMGEQTLERRREVGVADAMLEVVLGEQDLGDRASQLAEQVVVQRHQRALAGSGTRLALDDAGWTPLEAESLSPEPDRARAHQQDLLATVRQLADLLHQRADATERHVAVAMGDDAGTDLHHDAARSGELLANTFGHRAQLTKASRNVTG